MKKLAVIIFLVLSITICTALAESGQLQITSAKTANVRAKADKNSHVVATVAPNSVYEFTDLVDGWYKIVLDDGSTGYISKKLVEVIDSYGVNESDSESNQVDAATVKVENPVSMVTFDKIKLTVDLGQNRTDLSEFLGIEKELMGFIDTDVRTNKQTQELNLSRSKFNSAKFCGVEISEITVIYGMAYIIDGYEIKIMSNTKSAENLKTIKSALNKKYGKATETLGGQFRSSITINGRSNTTTGYSYEYSWDCGDKVIRLETSVKDDKKTVFKNSDLNIYIESK